VHITEHGLSSKQNLFATELLHTVGDMERIGDHIDNIAEGAEMVHNDGIRYSDESMEEFGYLKSAIDEILDCTAKAYETEDAMMALRVEALEDVIDDMVTVMKNNHAARLKEGLCTVERGVTFIEMLTDIERISDHCENVCQHLRQRINGQELSTHTVPGDDESRATERDMYDQFRRSYEAAYLTPIS